MALCMLLIKYTPEAFRNIAESGSNTTVDRAMRRYTRCLLWDAGPGIPPLPITRCVQQCILLPVNQVNEY